MMKKWFSTRRRQLANLDAILAERWDREWLHYFLESPPSVYFVSAPDLEVIADIRGKPALEVYETPLVRSKRLGQQGPLNVWLDGDLLVGKHILEIGCGPGYAGKQLGLIAGSYLGLDYSPLAIHIARLTAPPACTYDCIADLDRILAYAGTRDVMATRHFFIHQNYRNAVSLLTLAAILLKPGGVIGADFFLVNPERSPQPVTHSAKGDLDPSLPSCSFLFSREDIEDAAQETGFAIKEMTDIPRLQRRFVLFQKPEDSDDRLNRKRLIERRLREQVTASG